MNQRAASYRRMLFRLVRFGGMAVVAVLVLTACYQDIALEPSPTAGSLSAVTNVPPTQGNTQPQPTQGNQVKPPPTAGGGGAEQQNANPDGGGGGGDGGGGGGGASPEAVEATATRTPVTLVGSPVATAGRTVVAPPGSTTTPTTRAGTTPVRPGTTVPTRSAQGPATRAAGVTPPTGGTMTTGVTPPRTGTTPAGVTQPAGVTVTTTTGTGASPGPMTLLVITKRDNWDGKLIGGACFALYSDETMVASACDQGEGDGNGEVGKIAISAPPGSYMLRETTVPAGYTAGEDRPIDLVADQPLEIDVTNHRPATPEGSPSTTVADSVVYVALQDEAGQALTATACLELIGAGTSYYACDRTETTTEPSLDQDLSAGAIELEVVSGEYTLTVTAPAGYEVVDPPATVPVPAGNMAQFTLTFRLTSTTPTETATGEPTTDTGSPTETPTETVTTEASPPTETATTEASPPPVGYLLVTIYDAAGTQLGGACVTLTGPESRQICDGQDGDADTATAGSIEIIEIAPGDYTVSAQAPENYQPVGESETTVTVPSGNYGQVTFTFQPTTTTTTGAVRIDKVDAADGTTPLGGACFEVSGDNGTFAACDDQPEDADELVGTDAVPGVIVINNVVAGDYTLRETQAPPDRVGAAEQQIRVEAGQTYAVVVPNGTPTSSEPGTVNVRTLDPDGNAVPGACFTLAPVGGEPTEGCDDGDSVVTFEGLAAGDYTVTLTTIPEGYEASDVTEQTVTVVAGQPMDVAFPIRLAQPTTGTIVITKLDQATGAPLGLACFTATLAGVEPIILCDEDGDGTIRFEGLAPGDYTVTESTIPDGYQGAPEQTVTVTAGQESPLTFENQPNPVTGSLNVYTVNPDGAAVPGACFSVRGPNDAAADGCDEDGDGTTTFDGLVPGDYTVTLTTAPTEYEAADATEQTTTIAAGQPAELRFTVRPVQTTGTLVVTKVDAADGVTPLGLACFSAALPDQTPVDLCDDDGDGVTRFEGLPPGDYTVTETKAPEGYQAGPEQPITVPAGAETPLTFTNQKLPTTGTLTVYAANPEGAPIPGACYTATGSDVATVQGCDDDGTGDVPLGDVAAGDWTVREDTPPTGYAPADPIEQVVTVTGGQPAEVRFTNLPSAPPTGSIAITVQDEQGQLVPGACFDLAGADQQIRACDDVENDADPNSGTILVQNLIPGDYTVTESTVPGGYRGADPQTVTVAAGPDAVPVAFSNAKEPEGVPVPSPVVYEDDAGRLWLLRPGDPAPIRLDADDRPFDRSFAPVFTTDRTWVAFLVVDNALPAANMVWVKIEDLTFGGVDFTSIGQPRQIAWLPGSTDTLMVATELQGGGFNLYYYRTPTSELPVTLFPGDQQPQSVQAIIPAPSGQLVAIQSVDANGDPDVSIVNTADPAAPTMVNAGPNADAGADQFIAWSPAGDRLLLQAGDGLVYVVDEAGNALPLGTTPIFAGDASIGTAPQWSTDGAWISLFEGDPAAGGQLRFYDGNGNAPCDPIPSVIATDWSPSETRLWALVAPPNEQVQLVTIGVDCAQQVIVPFDGGPDKLLWAPDGLKLAIVDRGDVTTVQLLVGDQLQTVDMSVASVGLTDVLSWSPGGEMLALFAGGPSVSIWVVTPGAASPVAISGSTVPEGAGYVMRVWWD